MDARETPGYLDPADSHTLSRWLAEVSEGGMSRRQFVLRAAALGLSASSVGALLAACGSTKKGGAASASPMDTTLPDELVLYNWQWYIAPKALKDFQARHGIKVVQKYFETYEDMLAGLEKRNAYDVVVPTDMWITRLAEKKLVRSLDMSLIPSFDKYVTQPLFHSPSFDPGTDGVRYSVPNFFGSTGFAARLDVLPAPKESWDQLWDKRFKGKIGMLNTPRDAYAAALFSLGYSPNTTSQDELDQATQKLIQQKPLVGKYDSVRPMNSILAGFAATECWDGDAIGAMKEIGLSKVRYILPSQGYSIWADGFCIPTTAPSPYAAHLFLDFVLDPKIAAMNANYTGYQPVVEAADPMITNMVQRAMRPTADVLEKGVFLEDLGDFEKAYIEGWKKVKSA